LSAEVKNMNKQPRYMIFYRMQCWKL